METRVEPEYIDCLECGVARPAHHQWCSNWNRQIPPEATYSAPSYSAYSAPSYSAPYHHTPDKNAPPSDLARLVASPHKGTMRTFDSGATRDSDENKLDYEGFLSPIVLRRFAQYMDQHRKQKDGSIRSSDNWQRGIPRDVYMKSMIRHFMHLWILHRNKSNTAPLTEYEDILCAIMFNAMGYLFEITKDTVIP